MTAASLLADLRHRRVTMVVERGNRLRVEAPRGILTAELRDILREQKNALVTLLRAEQDPAVATLLKVFPGARVITHSQTYVWPPPGSWPARVPAKALDLETEQRPEQPCPACGERRWWRGQAMWVCSVCHPDPHQICAGEGDNLSDDGAALIDLARDLGWPSVVFRPGHSVIGNERGWCAFAHAASREDVAAARDALKTTESPAPRGWRCSVRIVNRNRRRRRSE